MNQRMNIKCKWPFMEIYKNSKDKGIEKKNIEGFVGMLPTLQFKNGYPFLQFLLM